MPQPVVAAVCYRHKKAQVEFLLVRTKGGKYWTFPKGHVERSELPWAAAKREAAEEAGVTGSIETQPFTFYAYPKGKDSREDIVAAFLLAVRSQHKPEELERDPQWFSPHAAAKKLAKGARKKKYVHEHRRVIKEALNRVS